MQMANRIGLDRGRGDGHPRSNITRLSAPQEDGGGSRNTTTREGVDKVADSHRSPPTSSEQEHGPVRAAHTREKFADLDKKYQPQYDSKATQPADAQEVTFVASGMQSSRA